MPSRARLTLPSTVFTHPRPTPRSCPVPLRLPAGGAHNLLPPLPGSRPVRPSRPPSPAADAGGPRPQSPACGTLSRSHPQRHRPAFFGDLHGRHKRRLALRPSRASRLGGSMGSGQLVLQLTGFQWLAPRSRPRRYADAAFAAYWKPRKDGAGRQRRRTGII